MKTFNFRHHQQRHVYLRLLLFARQYWLTFAIGISGVILGALTNAGFTWLLKPVLDKGFIERDHHFIIWLPVILFGAFLLRGIASFIGDYYIAYTGRQVVMQFRQEIFKHFLKMPAEFYDHSNSGKLLSALIYNVDQLAKASTDALVTVVQESFFVAGLLVVMFIDSWQLTLIYLIAIPFIALTARFASKRMRQISRNLQQSMGITTHYAQEAIEGYQVVRIFGGQEYELAKFCDVTAKNRQRELNVTATNSIATGIVQQVAGLAIAVIIYVATLKSIHLSAGGFASMMAAMLAILKPMKNLTNVSSTIQKGIAAAESIFTILDTPTEPDFGKMTLQKAAGELEFRNLSFHYPNSPKLILDNVNLTIPAYKTVALVGRSGAGKSTLAKLVPRFYEPTSGNILLDGTDIYALKLTDLRQQIGFVSQNITLFNDTIANNIAYGATADAEKIKNAAQIAHADEFIQQLELGYDTLIGDNGVLLSGGQRQRIAIARALYKNAPILILDEATSALDSESEFYIQEALTRLMQNRTTLVIAHRLSTIEKADLIVVMDQGKMLESGSHEFLLALNGHYAKFHRAEFKTE